MDTFCSDSLKADMSAVKTFEGWEERCTLHSGQLLERRKLTSEVTNWEVANTLKPQSQKCHSRASSGLGLFDARPQNTGQETVCVVHQQGGQRTWRRRWSRRRRSRKNRRRNRRASRSRRRRKKRMGWNIKPEKLENHPNDASGESWIIPVSWVLLLVESSRCRNYVEPIEPNRFMIFNIIWLICDMKCFMLNIGFWNKVRHMLDKMCLFWGNKHYQDRPWCLGRSFWFWKKMKPKIVFSKLSTKASQVRACIIWRSWPSRLPCWCDMRSQTTWGRFNPHKNLLSIDFAAINV